MYISEFLLAQSVWLQDIPKRPGAISRDLKVDDFPAAFGRVLDALGAREGLRALRQDVGYFSQSLFGSPVDLNNKHPSIPLRSTSDLACGWDFSKVSKVFGILQCGLSTCRVNFNFASPTNCFASYLLLYILWSFSSLHISHFAASATVDH